ncbi:DUF7847 domain-containing protein [Natronorubrum halophilum]|uniref:DUF7847 domain-containing protein n=1 Tax=Natronorubrum halophilum TaxID=1702106 RepID=UPI0010C1C143|nr:glycerophosphoryl diester phosphodiesterase membrane domain-containing protein [Natronorubrum halophilum]
MNGTLRRKGTIGTIGDAIGWLRRNPILIGVFFLYGLLDLFSELFGPIGGVLTLLGFFVGPYIDGLVHVVGAQEAAGETSDIGRASTAVLGRFLSLIGVMVLYILIVLVGLILFVLPGLYFGLRLLLAFPACVIDDQGAFESLDTSWTVAKGNLLKLFGISVALFLLAIATIVVTLLATGLEGELYLAVSAVFTAFVSPVVQFAYARVYLENRPVSDSHSDTTSRHESSWGSTDDRARDDPWGDDDW